MHVVEEQQKKRGKKSHRLYTLLVIIMALAIVAISILLLFHIQKINVVGTEYVSEREIVDSIQTDKYSTNALYVLGRYKFTNPPIYPALEAMDITLAKPWELKVRVYEKKVVGFIFYGNYYVYFDREGTVISRGKEFREGVPCIEGLEVSGAKLYETLPVQDKKVFQLILDTTQMIKKYELTPDRIVCHNAKIYLYFDDICVSLGSNNLAAKIAELPNLLPKLDETLTAKNKKKKGTLYLDDYQDASDMPSFRQGEMPKELSEEQSDAKQEKDTKDVQND